ncbi:MAG TPA: FecR family protein [Bacteroidales bacterium]|nr:FecR family protein [Bacteroidales bacterium]
MTNDDIIKKWLAGELSDEEKRKFESAEKFADVRKLSDALHAFKAPAYHTEEEYKKLSGRLFRKGNTITLYNRLKPVLKIAAIVIIAITLGYFSYNYLSYSLNGNGWIAEQPEVYLPDSSLAILNADSKIRFTEKTWAHERDVELVGEAFFKVKKGSQFNVKTDQGIVTVLGTRFNVKDRHNFYEVACYTGLVRVISGHDTVFLHPGEAFRIVNVKKEKYTFQYKPEPGWLHGESSFKSIPLKFVFAELERQYNINIETKNVNVNQLFSGSFTNNNLKIALKSVTIPANLRYTEKNNKVIVTVEDK